MIKIDKNITIKLILLLLFCYSQSLNLKNKYKKINIITIIIPIIVNHFDPCLFMYSVKYSPNLYER